MKKLKSWVIWLLVALTLLGVLEIVRLYNKEENDFVERCMNAGYSREYCIAHK